MVSEPASLLHRQQVTRRLCTHLVFKRAGSLRAASMHGLLRSVIHDGRDRFVRLPLFLEHPPSGTRFVTQTRQQQRQPSKDVARWCRGCTDAAAAAACGSMRLRLSQQCRWVVAGWLLASACSCSPSINANISPNGFSVLSALCHEPQLLMQTRQQQQHDGCWSPQPGIHHHRVVWLHDPICSTNTQLQTPRAYPPEFGYCVWTSCVQLPNPLAVGHLPAVGHVCMIQHAPP